jgi:hypothetical protein
MCSSAMGVQVTSATIILLSALVFSSSQAHAQDHWNIGLDADSGDGLGQKLVSELRYKLATSPQYTLRTGTRDSMFLMELLTLDPYNGQLNPQSMTVYACVMLVKDPTHPSMWHYVDQLLGTCTSDALTKCVSTIYVEMDTTFAPIIRGLDRHMEKARMPSPPRPGKKKLEPIGR